MKAYFLSIKDDPLDQGGFIVFAKTAKEARKEADSKDLMYERWIDVQAHRDKHFDDMEHLDAAHLALEQWKWGWRWVDYYDTPDADEATDEEFLAWYERKFS